MHSYRRQTRYLGNRTGYEGDPITPRRNRSAPGRFNITTREIGQIIEQNERHSDSLNTILHPMQLQRERVLEIMSRISTCPVRQKEEYGELLSNIDASELKRLTQERFYNSKLMAILVCLSESIYYGSLSRNNHGLWYNERIREWITNLSQVGAESVFGYAMRADLNDVKDLFIVKAPRSPDDQDLLYEMFVGLLGTNSLRDVIPNFAMIYGGFKCSPPVINSKNKQVVTWCKQTDPKVSVNYVLYENIAPGVDMHDYIKSGATGAQFLEKYMQVLYALHTAYKLIDFTHYDLHDKNVMIRKLPHGNYYIRYETENDIEYLRTDGVSTLIDYGTAHIKYRGRGYGDYTRMAYGVSAKNGYPMYDAYKLLLFSMFSARNNDNLEVYEIGARILRFFNQGDNIDDIVQKQRRYYYVLPRLPELEQTTILQLTSYIRQNMSTSFITNEMPSDGVLLGCSAGNCLSTSQLNARIKLNDKIPKPKTMVQMYDLITRLRHNGDESTLREIINRFDYSKRRDETANQITSLLKLVDRIRPNHIVSINNNSIQVIYNEDTLNLYRQYIVNVAQTIDTVDYIDFLAKAMGYVGEKYKDVGLPAWLQTVQYRIDRILYDETDKPNLTEITKSIKLDVEHLNRLRNSDQSNVIWEYTDRNKNLNWYETGLRSFLYMFSPN